MTLREFVVLIVCATVMIVQSILHIYEVKFLLTIVGSSDMAASQALDFVMRSPAYLSEPKKK